MVAAASLLGQWFSVFLFLAAKPFSDSNVETPINKIEKSRTALDVEKLSLLGLSSPVVVS